MLNKARIFKNQITEYALFVQKDEFSPFCFTLSVFSPAIRPLWAHLRHQSISGQINIRQCQRGKCAVDVLGRAGCGDDGGIDNRAGFERHAAALERAPDFGKELLVEVVLLQKATKLE